LKFELRRSREETKKLKMLLKLLVLAFVGYAVAQGIADPRCPVPDRNPAVRLPHDTDCTRHWICQGGNRHLMPACPVGMKFDSPSLSCRTPPVTCGPISTTVAPPVITDPPTTIPPPTDSPTTVPPTDPPTTVPPPTQPPPTAPTVPTTEATTVPPTDVPTTIAPTAGPSTAPPLPPTAPSMKITNNEKN
jgi:hypothetical protein